MNPQPDLAGISPPSIELSSLINDTHRQLAELRQKHSLVQVGDRQYMVLKAADVLSMLTDSRTIQIEGTDYVRLNRIPDGAVARLLRDVFLFSNADDHRVKRQIFAKAFAFSAMKAKRAEIRRAADNIVADLPRGEIIDFIGRMAARIPAEMIAGILGLPEGGIRYFSERVYLISRAISPVYPHAEHAKIDAAASELFDYIEAQVLKRLHLPMGDLLSELVMEWSDNPGISLESLIHQIIGIVIGGTDTTRAAFAMLVANLLQHPDQWQALKKDAGLIPGAVAEGLRYNPSVGSIARFTREPVQIDRVTLPPGVMLRLNTISAMRDPDLYDNPDRFDIRRGDHPKLHMVFGLGPHRCIGEMLARIEMEESLGALLAGVDHIELVTVPELIGCGGIRQITPMEVILR